MRKLLGALGLVLSFQLIAPYQLLAKPGSAAGQLSHTTANVQAGAAASGLSLNLASTHQSVSAALLNLSKSLYINVGGASELVNSATMLTPAEYVAASQVASGKNQTLSLAAGGNAVGGRMSLTSSLAQSLANLVIPQGVKLFDNFAATGTLQLSGNLVDAGKFVAVSSSPSVTGALIDANNIYVQAGGILTSVLSAKAPSGLNSTLSLSLDALNSVVNNGTISSSASLFLSAGGSITNGAAGSMQAQNDVNLFAASGNFTNGGMVTSSAGNINVNTLDTSNLAFNGGGGTLSAQNGAINFRNAGYAGSANLTLNGGNYLSQALNLNSGTGTVDMSVDNVTGVVNTYAGSAHLGADTPNLNLGAFDVSGDPFVYNNGGNLNLNATITGTLSYLVATAAGSIYTSVAYPYQSINTSGGNVVLAAGVTATDSSGTITLSRSGMGGDIYLAAGTTIDGNQTQYIQGFNTNGGNVTLLAMTNGSQSNPSGGHVMLPVNQTNVDPENVTINTVNGSNAGSVTILAESSDTYDPETSYCCGGAIAVGGVNANGTGGNITIKSETANLAGATINDTNGTITGSFDNNNLQGGDITIGYVNQSSVTPISNIAAGGSLTMATNGQLYFAPGNYSGKSVSLNTSGIISFWAYNGTNNYTTTVSATAGDLDITGMASGLTLQANGGTSSFTVYSATGGQVNLSGGAGGTVQFEEFTGFTLDSDTAVNITANNSIVIQEGGELANSTSGSAWTLTAPTVQLNDGSSLTTSNSANVTIHTNNLNIGDHSLQSSVSISASGVLTVDDNPNGVLTASGLTITSNSLYENSSNTLSGSSVSINATAVANDTLTIMGANIGNYDRANLSFGGTTSVSFTANGQITVGESTNVESLNSNNVNWSMTAPAVLLQDFAEIDTTQDPGTLAIHTNQLTLGDGSFNGAEAEIYGTNITIDNNSSGAFSTTGLTVSVYGTSNGGQGEIYAEGGTLGISATTGGSGASLLFTSTTPGNPFTLSLGGDNGVSLTAKNQITIDQNATVNNGGAGGSWTMTGPTVQLNDGASLSPSSGLTIHTNSLNLGNGADQNAVAVSANGVAIDDNFTGTAGGVTITGLDGVTEMINANGGTLSITAAHNSSSNVEFSSMNGTGTTIQLESSNAVNISAKNEAIVDNSMILSDNSSGGNWTITAPTVTVNNLAAVAVHTGSLTVHTDNLNLFDPNPNITYIPVSLLAGDSGITIDDNGGTVFTTTGTLTITVADGDNPRLYSNGGYEVSSSGTLLFQSTDGNSAYINFADTNNTSLIADSQVTVASNMDVDLSFGSVTAPTVQLDTGAELEGPDSTLYVHTNNLNLYNNSQVYGDFLTIDDNGSPVFTSYGLTITTTGSATLSDEFAPTINATSNQNSTLQFNGSGSTLTLFQNIGSQAGTVTANKSISFGPNATVSFQANSQTIQAPTVQAPTVSLSDGASVQFSDSGTVSTNNLNLGNGDNVNAAILSAAGSLTINDSGMATPGLTITAYRVATEYLQGTQQLTIESGAATSFVSSDPLEETTLGLASSGSVSVSGTTQVQFGRNVAVSNIFGETFPGGGWTVSAPTVSLADGSSITVNSATAPTSIAIHTNNLNLGDGSNGTSTSITGNGNVTIDDTGMATPGLTIDAYGGLTQYIHAVTVPATEGNPAIPGMLSLNTSTTLLLTSGSFANLVLDGDAGVALTAANQITVDHNMFVQNQYSIGAWTVTAPTVALNDGGAIDTAGTGASLTVHTNTLYLGDDTSLSPTYLVGNGLTIDDVGFAANSGVTIISPAHLTENLAGGNSFVSINATNGSNDFIAFAGGTGSVVAIDGGVGTIALTASGSITLNENEKLGNINTDTPWVITAPTVQLNDESSINTTGSIGIGSGLADLTIHTNYLGLGNGASGIEVTVVGNNVTIDDNGGSTFSAFGLTVACANGGGEAISAQGNLQINGTAVSGYSTLLLTSATPGSGSSLFLDGAAVTLAASTQLTVDQNMFVLNDSSSGNWTVTAQGVTVGNSSAIGVQNGGSITFNVNSQGQIVPVYPQDLNLSAIDPAINIPSVPTGVTVGSGSSVASDSGSTITINGQSYSNYLAPGTYAAGTYSVTIATGNGPLTITPTTLVTPAEWVAAEQVSYNSGNQMLTVGADNAAAGGNFTVSSTYVPLGGFSAIVIPSTTPSTTMLVAVSSLTTNSLTNNGVIAPATGQTNVTITSAGTTSGNLEIAGTGTFNAPGGTVYFETSGTGALTIDNATSQAITGAFTAISPTINVGSAAASYTVSATGATNVHTNTLNMGSGSVLAGGSVTIDDNGGSAFSTSGLTISTQDSAQAFIQAVNGALAINAGANSSDTILLTSWSGNGATLNLDGSTGVSVSASSQVTIDQYMYVENSNSSGNLTLTSPTVQLSDGATLDTTKGTGPASLSVHTNNLVLGDDSNGHGTNIFGNGVSIDDDGGTVFTTTGLTISVAAGNGYGQIIRSFAGALAINATADPGSTLTINTPDSYANLYLDGDTGVSLTANSQVTVGQNLYVANKDSSGGWTVTAPTVALDDGSAINAAAGGASLTVHTNNLILGDDSNENPTNLGGNGLTIDDAGFAANSGLTISVPAYLTEYIGGSNGSVSINATNGVSDSITFLHGWQSTLIIDGGVGTISMTASNQITFRNSEIIGNSNSSTPWVITAPVVQLNDGAVLATTDSLGLASGPGADLTMHTNNLILGDDENNYSVYVSGNNVTIDDNGGTVFAGTGLTITSADDSQEYITASQNLQINASASPVSSLLITSLYGDGSSLYLDGSAVSMTANFQMTVDNYMSVSNSTSAGNWTVTAEGVVLNDNAAIGLSNSAGITFNVSTISQITPIYPQDLDLSSNAGATLNIPAEPNGVTLGNDASIAGGSIAINGQSYTSPLETPGTYGGASSPYSVTIATASGSLTISPSTEVTPAEWVAADQVAYEAGQSLTIGADGSASGGSFTIGANIPTGGFYSIVIPATNPAITMYVSAPAVATNYLENNGVITASGTQTNVTITSFGTSGPNSPVLEIAGTGTFSVPSGTVYLEAPFNEHGQSGIQIDDGTNQAITGALTIIAPSVYRDSDSSAYTLSATGALSVHTNYLELSTLSGSSVTIDDNQMAPGSGLSIWIQSYSQASITATNGAINLTATNVDQFGRDSFQFGYRGSGAYESTLTMDATAGVNITAATEITFRNSQTVGNSTSTGAWTITAPSVRFNDGATLETNGVLGVGGNGANLTIHTNYLGLGDNSDGRQVSLTGNSVTVDDVGMAAGSGLQIDVTPYATESITAANGTLNLNATNVSRSAPADSLTFEDAWESTLILDASSGVNMTATTQITFRNSQTVGNSTSTGSWTLTAPTIQFNDGATLETNGALGSGGSGADLTMHTNNLNLGDDDNEEQVSIAGNNVTIDDAGMVPGSGLLINIPVDSNNGLTESIAATNGTLTISAANTDGGTVSDSLTLGNAAIGNNPNPVLILDAATAVNITAATAITVTQAQYVINSWSTGAWTVTAPTVNIDDNASINPSNGNGSAVTGTSLTVYTNTLNMGDGSNGGDATLWGNSLTVSDQGMTTGGLAVVTPAGLSAIMAAVDGSLAISATNGSAASLSFTGSGSSLTLDGSTTVSLTANNQITFAAGLSVSNASNNTNWTVTAPTVQVNGGASIALVAGTGIAFNVGQGAVITTAYPQALDLSATSPSLYIPASGGGSGLVVTDDNSVSTTGSISINGQPYTSPIDAGSYGASSYAITIATGTSGTLTITPNTPVTPAEWVAAEQVFYNSGDQPLNVGSDNAASGGSFSLFSANIPSGGFSTIVIPSTVNGITMYVLSSSVPTLSLINNGTIAASGQQTSINITTAGTGSGNLSISGNGTFIASNGVSLAASSALSFANGCLMAVKGQGVPGKLTIISPVLTLGVGTDSGNVSAALGTDGGSITVQGDANGDGNMELSLLSGGAVTSGTLNLNGGAVTTTSTNMTLDAGTILSSDSAVTFNANGGTFTNNGEVQGSTISVESTSTLVLAGGSGGVAGIYREIDKSSPMLFSAASSIAFANGTNLTMDSDGEGISFTTPQLILGAGSDSGNVTASVTAIPDGTYTVTLSYQDAISLLPGGSVTTGTLNLNGVPVAVNATNLSVDPGVTFSSDNAVVLNVNGGTFTNNGEIDGETVAVQSTSTLVLAGGNGTTEGIIRTTDSSSPVLFSAATSTTIANGLNMTIDGSGPGLTLTTPMVLLGASGDSGAVSGTIKGNKDICCMSFQWGETNSSIVMAPSSGGSVTSGTLNLTGFTVATTSMNLALAAGTTLSSDNAVVLNVNGGTFTNNGEIDGETVAVQSTSTLVLAGGNGTTEGIIRSNDTTTPVSFSAATSTTIANGLNMTIDGSGPGLTLTTPMVLLGASGDSGAVSGTIKGNKDICCMSFQWGETNSSIAMAPSSGGSVTSGTLNLTGFTVATTSMNLALAAGTTLSSDNAVVLNVNGGTFTNNGEIDGETVEVASTSTLVLAGGNQGVSGVIKQTDSSTPVMFSAATALSFANGVNMSIATSGEAVQFTSPSFTLGAGSDSGKVSATVTTEGGAISLQASNDGTGDLSLSLLSGVTGGGLALNGGAVTTTSTNLTMSTGTMVSSGNSITVNTAGNMTLASLVSTNASVSAINGTATNGGNITVLAGSQISSVNGNITLNNNNTTNSSIAIGANVTISATSLADGQGNVSIIFGNTSTVAGQTPRNVKVVASNQGTVLFGSSSSTITASTPTNNIYANGKQVNFGTATGTSISLGGGDYINASQAQALTSLDLTDPTTVQLIQSEQASKLIGGTLIVQGGVAVGGTVILAPANLSPVLTAEYIPSGVTLTYKGFQASNAVTVNLTPSSTQTTVYVNGTMQFSGPPASVGVENINSTVGGVVLNEGAAGTGVAAGIIKSDGTLTLSLEGSALLGGTVVGTTATTINTLATGNGSITNSGTLGNKTGTTTISVGGSGNLIQGASIALIQGSTVNLTSVNGSGSIGAGSSQSAAIAVSAATVSVNTSGASSANAYVRDLATSPVKLGTSSVGGNFSFTSNSALSLAGSVTAGSTVSLSISGTNGAIALGAFNVSGSTIYLTAAGSGAITQTTGQLLGTDVYLMSTTGSIGGSSSTAMINTDAQLLSFNTGGSGSAYLNDSGAVTLDASSGATVVLNAGGDITLAQTLTSTTTKLASATGSNGSIAIDANLGSSKGAATITADGSGNITDNGSGAITGNKVTLTSGSGFIGGGDIGASIMTVTPSIIAHTGAGGSVYLMNSGAVTISGASSAGASTGTGTWQLAAVGNITDSGALTAGTVNLSTANNSNGNIKVAAVMNAGSTSLTTGSGTAGSITTSSALNVGTAVLTTGSGTNGSIMVSNALGTTIATDTLTANGSGAITVSGAGKLQGSSVFVSSTTGVLALGNVNSTSVTAQTGGTAKATVTISAANAVLNSGATAGGAFSVSGANGLTVGSITAASISAVAKTGNLTLTASDTLNAMSGSVVLQAASTTTGSVTIGNGATIEAAWSTKPSSATIGVYVGAVARGTNTTAQTNVSTTGSTAAVYFGRYGIGASTPTNNVTADAATVTFNSARNVTPSAIQLDGGTTIQTNPISFERSQGADAELVVDTGDDGQDNDDSAVNLVDALQ